MKLHFGVFGIGNRFFKVGALLCFTALSTPFQVTAQVTAVTSGAGATLSAEHFDDFATHLRDMLQDWIIGAEVDKAVERSKTLAQSFIKADGDGYLIRVRVYQNSEGVKQLGDSGNVQIIGSGKNMDEVVRNFVRSPPAELAPMTSKMDRAAEDGFLIWTYQKDGKLVTKRTDYPMSEAVFENAKVAIEKEREAAAHAEAAKAAAEREAAARGAALNEYNRRQTEEMAEAQRRALAEQEAKRRAEIEENTRRFQQMQIDSQRRMAEEQQRLQQQRALAAQQQAQQLRDQIAQQALRNSMGQAPIGGGGPAISPGGMPGVAIPGRR
ncbi:hypothetical protein [Bradyrhizobium sp. 195]|uniref:hypothetical protein n=1 Tax=Bradyrhizobium sp. 195 TaxID=2782662 RepID=UPI002000F43B|nr:hypothetical protein [Bradyrhizobium sp. 195]UPK26752.1 hypothetical protein IVB26_36920 [Bradyrhizobium sp. 195]